MTTANTIFRIEDYLARESQKDLLRFSTAGSVDDGKSTLIGRLLYDTQTVYEDQVRAIEGKGTTAPGQIDFALLTDGLRAEREQGITIDVAYRYFATDKRKFIIADTPGHEQYTRNMATGASTADAAVVLIDASKGALVQSLRHAYIASLLRVGNILVAVNKMDLIGYKEENFRAIEKNFTQQLEQIAEETGNPVDVHFVPVSALAGDNVVHASTQMLWYDGPTLLGLLELLPASGQQSDYEPFRFPVQRVLRPNAEFRGFAGQIASGTVHVGDAITIFPTGTDAKVARIVTFDGDLAEASAPLSVTLVLDREVDVSRGDLIAARDAQPQTSRYVEASLVWMDQRPLDLNRRYLLKHASRIVPVYVRRIESRIDIATLTREPAETLELNAIGRIEVELLRPLAFDPYNKNRATGAFILIDAESNATAAAGMIRRSFNPFEEDEDAFLYINGPVTAKERSARWGHRGAHLEIAGTAEAIDAVERALFSACAVTQRIDLNNPLFAQNSELRETFIDLQVSAGILVIDAHEEESDTLTARAEGRSIQIDAADRRSCAAAVYRFLQEAGIIFEAQGAGI
jgi:sulfate adenylyltransferase subunit 1